MSGDEEVREKQMQTQMSGVYTVGLSAQLQAWTL